MADLRKDKRAPASLKVKYKSATVDEFIEQFGLDVSSGGIFVKTKKPIETGALLKLELQLSDASPVIHGVGRVCWRREPGPDASLPAGMGIKFIKLDPGSRTIVDRIVQARGPRPSRFDQTEGAEVAPPSIPPEGETPAPAPIKPAQAPPSKPGPAAAAARPSPTPAPAATKPAVPARAPSPGASAVAGLFADSPLARDSSPDPSPPGGRRHSSFFPPPADPSDAAAAEPPRGQRVPPAAFGATAKPAAARAEHSRQSGEFLAAALAAGGVAEPASAPAPLPESSKPAEDELIDQLFADVMSSGRNSTAPGAARAGADPGSVDDVFAALSEEEGLGSGAAARPVSAAKAPERVPPPRTSRPERASEPDNVDQLFAEMDGAPARSARGAPAPRPAPKPAPQEADSFEAEWDRPTKDLEETDLAASSLPPNALPAAPSEPAPPPMMDLGGSLPASAAPAPTRSRSPLLWIVPLVIAAAGGGYFYYQRQLAARIEVEAEPRALERGARHAPAGAEPAVLTGGATALAGAEAHAAAAGAAAEDDGAETVRRERTGAGAAAAGERVEVEITSLPRGASVQVNGRVIGVSPLHASLPTGRQAEVAVSSEGYATMTRQVVPDAAENEPLRFKLEPLPYVLNVRTVPPDAELAVGPVTAIAPGPLELGHLDGGVQVSVGKAGYQRMTRPVRLDEFREDNGVMRAEIEVSLSPLPGGVTAAPVAPPPRPRPLRRRAPAPPAAPAPPTPPTAAAPPSPPETSAPPPDLRPEAVAPVRNE